MDLQVSGFLGIIFFLAALWAMYRIINSTASTGKKVLWICFILFLPLVGLLVWFFIGPKG